MRQCVLEGGQGTQEEGRGVWAKRDLLELDAPLRRRLGQFWGMRDGEEASHDGGHVDGGSSFCSPAQPHWIDREHSCYCC